MHMQMLFALLMLSLAHASLTKYPKRLCENFFYQCQHSKNWPNTPDVREVITEECWPFATKSMRDLTGDKQFLCPRKIYSGFWASYWPEVSEDMYELYADNQQEE